MELLFENSHTREKEFFKEMALYLCFKRPFAIIGNICAIILLVSNIPLLFLNEHRAIHIYIIIVSLLIILVGVLGYFKYIKAWYSRELEMRGTQGIIVYTIEVYPDKLVHSSSLGTRQELELSQIKKVVKTKNYIYLQSTANLLYVFDKKGFTIGTVEEFLSFLKAKKLCK